MIRSGLTATLALTLGACSTLGVDVVPRRPNVVLILVDDLGWADLGCYGSDFHETPHLDRLAAEGARFTDAYATAPVCSPSRVSIQCGKLPARTGITDWIPGMRWPHAPLVTPEVPRGMSLEETTLAGALGGVGYQTWHVGKWHLGDPGGYPEDHGYDVNVGGHSKGAPGSYFFPYAKKTPAVDWSVKNLPPGGAEGEYLTDRLTDETLALLDARDRTRPFFLHFSTYTVHTPIEGRPDLVEHYRAKKADGVERRQTNARYAAMVHCLDENVGRLVARLEAEGILDETVILFTSDNGGLESVTDNHPFRAGKGHLYEGGIREPFFVRWPGVVEPGTVRDDVVTGVDLYPTILSMAGTTSHWQADVLDGADLVPLLRGKVTGLSREAVYWHYPHYHTPQRPPTGAVRMGDYKLLERYATGALELYDLAADPGETNNLVDTHLGLARALRDMLHAHLDELDAPRNAPNPDHDPEKPWRGSSAAWTELDR